MLQAWTTASEKKYLKSLGSHAENLPSEIFSRADKLRGYLAGLEKRTDFTDFDGMEIKIFAGQELAAEEVLQASGGSNAS